MKVEEPITEYGQLNPDGLYTYFDYLKWQFAERVELIKGKIFKMSPAPSRRHQKVLRGLVVEFDRYLISGKCEFYPAPFDVRLPIPNENKPTTVVQPDICVICNPDKLDEQGCNGAPDLIVEILSPGNAEHDLKVKHKLYEEAAVPEYWVIDPHQKAIQGWILEYGRYRLISENKLKSLKSLHFPGLEIPAELIFKNLD